MPATIAVEMDLMCDAIDDQHAIESQAQFVDVSRSKVKRAAHKAGWRYAADGKTICPKCTPYRMEIKK